VVHCGAGNDIVVLDRFDAVRDCEQRRGTTRPPRG
jgi:hypothetical protein